MKCVILFNSNHAFSFKLPVACTLNLQTSNTHLELLNNNNTGASVVLFYSNLLNDWRVNFYLYLTWNFVLMLPFLIPYKASCEERNLIVDGTILCKFHFKSPLIIEWNAHLNKSQTHSRKPGSPDPPSKLAEYNYASPQINHSQTHVDTQPQKPQDRSEPGHSLCSSPRPREGCSSLYVQGTHQSQY